jgi:hypothetical protein
MTFEFFNSLSYRQQTELVLQGTFLADRLTDEHYVKLYNVHTFYVEVFFEDSTHLITNFRAFRNEDHLLWPYLCQLPIAGGLHQ